MADKRETMWKCEIGIVGKHPLPYGADKPMREAIARAFRELTGRDPEFLFSGWGNELTDEQRVIVAANGPGIDGVYAADLVRKDSF